MTAPPPFRIVSFDHASVLLESGERTKHLVIRAPTGGELRQFNEAVRDGDETEALRVAYGLASLDQEVALKIAPNDLARLDAAIGSAIEAELLARLP
jgi:hypothetical protein